MLNTPMTYENFEDTPAWQQAARLYELAEDLLENSTFHASAFSGTSLTGQHSRSPTISRKDSSAAPPMNWFTSYNIARGSAGETRSMLRVKLRRASSPAVKSQISELISCATSCSRQLRGWAGSLQNSDIQGQRHLNDRNRRDYAQRKRAAEFQKELLMKLPPGHPLRKAAAERGDLR